MSDAAAKELDRAAKELEKDPLNSHANGALATLLHAYGKLPEAETAYRRTQALEPENARWDYYRGLVLDELGRHAEAAEEYSRVLERREYKPARLRHAIALEEAGRASSSAALRSQGRSEMEQLLADNPKLPETRLALARSYAADGDNEAVIEQLTAALDAGESFQEAHRMLAQAYAAVGDAAQADRHRTLAADPGAHRLIWKDSVKEPLDDLAATEWSARERGVAQAGRGNMPAAAREFRKAADSDPTDVRSRTDLIALYGMMGRRSEALEAYDEAVAIDPSDSTAHLNLATLRLDGGRYAEAEGLYRKALAADRLNGKAAVGLARSLEAQGRRPEALEALRRGVLASGHSVDARMEYARFLADAGDFDGALVEMRTAAHYADGRARLEIERRMADVYSGAGDLEAARTVLLSAREAAERASDHVQLALIDSQLKALDR